MSNETDNDEGPTTESTATRWDYTNDALAALLVTSVPALVALSAYNLLQMTDVPVEVRLAWLTLAAVATAWAFGPGAIAAAAKLRSK